MINKFLYKKGGDATTTIDTGRLLTQKGNEVVYWGMQHPNNPKYPFSRYFVRNVNYAANLSIRQKAFESLKILYSFEARNRIEKLIKIIKPDIAHVNNFAHQISPSILDVLHKYQIPIVMTLHDYKLVCPAYSMFYRSLPCEKCKGGKYYWCLIRKCTKGSYFKSLINTIEMYIHHKVLHIYNKIDFFICPSAFIQQELVHMGFTGNMVHIPNFIDFSDYIPSYENKTKKVCYFGRLSSEKGLITLVEAVKGTEAELVIIGDGPLKEVLEAKCINEKLRNVHLLGYKHGDELRNEISKCCMVILPSECYENNPRTILEAFALGKPVIGSNIGGIPELVIHGETGYLFKPGDFLDLRKNILALLNNTEKLIELGRNARRFVENNYGPDKYYYQLMSVYKDAINHNS